MEIDISLSPDTISAHIWTLSPSSMEYVVSLNATVTSENKMFLINTDQSPNDLKS